MGMDDINVAKIVCNQKICRNCLQRRISLSKLNGCVITKGAINTWTTKAVNINFNSRNLAKSLRQLDNVYSSTAIDCWWPLFSDNSNTSSAHFPRVSSCSRQIESTWVALSHGSL
ncbi:hypothetical protein FGO68_gene7531 [Halteria grandinella]|uniref:Uncharacterized protein n=1 Tax=Halteria grandinella TaxID=5974 RepID=A0A8J8N8X9_HALGN|nr:hypothetical protein FGO68_gene7531 [Halteria grandinella]